MEAEKEKWIGIGGTVLFHVLLILVLLFLYLTPTSQARTAEEYAGIPVMFGNVADAFGDNESIGKGAGTDGAEATLSPDTPEDQDPIPLIEATSIQSKPSVSNAQTTPRTQDFEETIAIKEANRKAEEQKTREAEEQRKKAEAERIAREEVEKSGQIDQKLGNLFNPKGSEGGSRGNTQGEEAQGVPTGNASHGATSGIGGRGTFSLDGRSLGRGGLVDPLYDENDYGTVVVDILVNSKGDVLEATISKGTKTTSSKLMDEALKAAKKTKFNEVSAVTNQKGTITYKFGLN